ncbi:glutamate carboxypeptidase [Sphaerosporella brunnea]|uniref:Glutamate carboxypeptidase n=1 Tax=Sphaerosporella brunnea TaxID=1250544 RepID=A0A5J5F5E8_9PEZI|nr:glutamate carboxypeptidase [Sphaerosporella brunnea]
MKALHISEKQDIEFWPRIEPDLGPSVQARSSRAALVLGGCLSYLALSLFLFPSWPPFRNCKHSKWHRERMPLSMLEEIMMLTPQEEEARKHSDYYTSGPHLGGKNFSQAMWTKERWEEYGIPEVEIVSYDIYTNYPKSHRLGLLKAKGDDYKLLYEASLEEPALEEDPTTALKDRIPTFHGYSANGNVTAEFVYANYGTYNDFEDLLSHGVNVTGKVVLCKYGHIFRGLKVKRAQDLGAVGVLIYSDPGDDGKITELNGYKAYPDGPARNKESVQRGSVQFLSFGPGDPTTPGYASKPGVERQDPSPFIPSIPSLPISYMDALPLLTALNGHGKNTSEFGEYWRTGGLYHKNVQYFSGPAKGIVVNLHNEVEYVITPHWNVIGKIPGYIKDETVIIGNHRDAWIAGGAADPNSGSAALLEIAKSFGKMIELGWKPARTILLASWDGEEYGLLGSTEWVEDHQKLLHTTALAYLNVDVGARSPVFSVAANPLLQDLVFNATQKVVDPNRAQQGHFDDSVYDVWNKKVRTLGSGSDYTAFQDHLGIPSVDMGFGGEDANGPVYHYHSNYDSFHWMEKFGDPGFKYHVAIAKIWGLMALQLAETPIVSFNATAYASSLACLKDFVSASQKFDAEASRLAHELAKDIPWWNWWKKAALWLKARAINQKYKYLDRAFLHPEGLDDGRHWFKHVVYAPGKWTGYSGDVFPGLLEAGREGNWTNVCRWVRIIRHSVDVATKELSGPL